jgi:uroporphyrinogen decarboxylase
MTSKERVLLSFDHQEPDLVPRWCGASPGFWEKAKEELEVMNALAMFDTLQEFGK